MRAALETQMDQLRDVHHKQVRNCFILISIAKKKKKTLIIFNF